MPYTYEDFMNKAQSSGLLGEFSQADLSTAQRYPEFGMSILNLKQDYRSAGTDEQRLLANEAANELRKSYQNYAGGTDGSAYVSAGKIPGQIDNILDQIAGFGSFSYDKAAPTYQDPYAQQTQDLLSSMLDRGEFSYGAAPTYQNQYAQRQGQLLDDILGREDFSWSKEQDPQWSAYKKQYLREGERATANALGQASAASGGRPSSFAVNAASQAGDYYGFLLMKKIVLGDDGTPKYIMKETNLLIGLLRAFPITNALIGLLNLIPGLNSLSRRIFHNPYGIFAEGLKAGASEPFRKGGGHYFTLGQDVYELRSHNDNQFSLLKNGQQTALYQKELVTWGEKNTYHLFCSSVGKEQDILELFCIFIDVRFYPNYGTYSYWKEERHAVIKDPCPERAQWRPEE